MKRDKTFSVFVFHIWSQFANAIQFYWKNEKNKIK